MHDADLTEAHLTPKQLAKRWHTTEGTLKTWRSAGRGPSYIKPSRCVLYPLQQVRAYENAARVDTYGNPSSLMAPV